MCGHAALIRSTFDNPNARTALTFSGLLEIKRREWILRERAQNLGAEAHSHIHLQRGRDEDSPFDGIQSMILEFKARSFSISPMPSVLVDERGGPEKLAIIFNAK